MASIVQGTPVARTKTRFSSGTTSTICTHSSSVTGPASNSPSGDVLCDTVSAPRTRLIPLTDWVKHHNWPPVGGLRHLVFFEKTNGFANVVKRIGRRVLIDEIAFFKWVDGQQGKPGTDA